jgi:Zn-dependent protease with chaperone function
MYEQHIDALIKNAEPVPPNHTVSKILHKLARENNLVRTPRIMFQEGEELSGLAIPIRDTILISPQNEISDIAYEGVIAHELGHVLAQDIRAIPRVEQTMDRLAVQFSGSQEPMLAALTKIKEIRGAKVAAVGESLQNSGIAKEHIQRLQQANSRLERSQYGDLESRIANVERTDPAKRRQLDKLIARRNQSAHTVDR